MLFEFCYSIKGFLYTSKLRDKLCTCELAACLTFVTRYSKEVLMWWSDLAEEATPDTQEWNLTWMYFLLLYYIYSPQYETILWAHHGKYAMYVWLKAGTWKSLKSVTAIKTFVCVHLTLNFVCKTELRKYRKHEAGRYTKASAIWHIHIVPYMQPQRQVSSYCGLPFFMYMSGGITNNLGSLHVQIAATIASQWWPTTTAED